MPLGASDDRGDLGSNQVKEKNTDEKEEEVVQSPMHTRRMPKIFEDYILRLSFRMVIYEHVDINGI